MTLSNQVADGGGGFGLEFGNNGIANDANLTPCSTKDSRDIQYLTDIFTFIADRSTLLNPAKVRTTFSGGVGANEGLIVHG